SWHGPKDGDGDKERVEGPECDPQDVMGLFMAWLFLGFTLTLENLCLSVGVAGPLIELLPVRSPSEFPALLWVTTERCFGLILVAYLLVVCSNLISKWKEVVL